MENVISKFLVLTVFIIGFGSCQKDEPLVPKGEEDPIDNYSALFEEDDLGYSKQIEVVDKSKQDSAIVLVSSTSEALLDYFLIAYNIGIIVNPNIDASNYVEREGASNTSENLNQIFPEDWIIVEIEEKAFLDEDAPYIVEVKKKLELKSYPFPPTTYYIGYKFEKRKKAKMWYFPDDTYNDELLYKWGYTESWLGRWYWDTYWYYLYGYSAYQSPMQIYHPLNDMDLYRLGISMYYDDANYFHLMSY
jgi:hypothetical protein